jgi:hypothetical protein
MPQSLGASLHSRLLIIALALAALPAWLIGSLAYRNARRIVEDRFIAQLTSAADLNKEQINIRLEERTGEARLLGDNFLDHCVRLSG